MTNPLTSARDAFLVAFLETRPNTYTAMLREVVGLSPRGPVWPAGEESAQ